MSFSDDFTLVTYCFTRDDLPIKWIGSRYYISWEENEEEE